ncbi:MAG: hypothetical protein ABI761_04860 [Saprospiraceae bacterium]
MNPVEKLMEALKFYNIEVISINENKVKVPPNFEIEIEANGIFKLLDDGYIVGPFADERQLCRFILS